MNNQQEILRIEGADQISTLEKLINRWKAMARVYYHNKDYTNATLCKTLRNQAAEEINRLKGQ